MTTSNLTLLVCTKDPRRRLRQLGVAYVRFALAYPSHLRIMFGPETHDKTAYPTLQTAGDRAFDLLVASISAGLARR